MSAHQATKTYHITSEEVTDIVCKYVAEKAKQDMLDDPEEPYLKAIYADGSLDFTVHYTSYDQEYRIVFINYSFEVIKAPSLDLAIKALRQMGHTGEIRSASLVQ